MTTNREEKELFPADLADSLNYQKWVEEGKKAIANIFEERENGWKKIYIYQNGNISNDKNRTSSLNDAITKKYQDLETVYLKRLFRVGFELGQNGTIHGKKDHPVAIKVYEKIENNTPFICIETINIMEQASKEILKNKIDIANKLSKVELKEKQIEAMSNSQFSDKWTAGVWYWEMVKKVKDNDDDKPIEYVFWEEIPWTTLLPGKICCKINLSQSKIADKIGVSEDTEIQIANNPAA